MQKWCPGVQIFYLRSLHRLRRGGAIGPLQHSKFAPRKMFQEHTALLSAEVEGLLEQNKDLLGTISAFPGPLATAYRHALALPL